VDVDRSGATSGTRSGLAATPRYQMREKLLSIGDDSWIENADGERVFKVNGKALRVRQTLSFEDLDGNELCKIQERKLRVKDSTRGHRGDASPDQHDPNSRARAKRA
jgi:uncharacterized protein YxjI